MASSQSDAAELGRLAEGASGAAAAKLTGRALTLVTSLVLARLLGPTGFGLFAVGLVVARLLGIAAPFGLPAGVLRFVAREADDAGRSAVARRASGLAFALGAIAAAALALAAPILANRVFDKPDLVGVFRVFALSVPLLSVLAVAAAATRTTRRVRFAAIAEDLTPPVVQLAAVGVAALLGMGLLGMVAAFVAAQAAGAALSLAFAHRVLPSTGDQASGASPRELLAFSAPAAFAGMIGALILWVDRLFVGALRPAADAGLYHAAAVIAALFNVLLGGVNAILAPTVASLLADARIARVEELHRVSTKWALIVSWPLVLSCWLLPDVVCRAVFGAEYGPAAVALAVLATGQLVNVATGSVGVLLVQSGRTRPWLVASMVALTTSCALCAWLVPRHGPTGAAIATAVSTAVLYVGGLLSVRRALGIWPHDRRHAKGVAAAAVAAAAVALVSRAPLGDAAMLAVGLATCVVVFFAALASLGLDPEDRAALARLGRALPGAG